MWRESVTCGSGSHLLPRGSQRWYSGWQVGSEHLLAPGTLCPAQLSRSHRPLTAWLDLAPCFLAPSVPTTFLPWAPALSASMYRSGDSVLFYSGGCVLLPLVCGGFLQSKLAGRAVLWNATLAVGTARISFLSLFCSFVETPDKGLTYQISAQK